MNNYYQPMQYYTPQYPAAYPDRLSQMQQQYTQPVQQSPASPTSQGLIWVQGEAAAKSYLVAPGSTVLLMDSDGDYFYLKTADNAGMPVLRTFAYKEVTGQTPAQNPPQDMDKRFVTREEYDKLVDVIRQMAEERKGVTANAEQPV